MILFIIPYFTPPNLPPGECEVPCKFFVNLIINRACTGYQAYLYTEHKHKVVGHMQVKGTVPRDVFLIRFFIRQIFPVPIDIFCWIWMDLILFLKSIVISLVRIFFSQWITCHRKITWWYANDCLCKSCFMLLKLV